MIEMKRLVAYSLLAHINDSERGIRDLLQVFLPLVQKALSEMSAADVRSGRLEDLKETADQLFGIDMPYGFVKALLERIAAESNGPQDERVKQFADGSFQLNDYAYDAIDEPLESQARDIAMIEEQYYEFLKMEGLSPDETPSLFDFVDVHRVQLAGFFAKGDDVDYDERYIAPALFVETIRNNNNSFGILRRVYLGSVISAYLELDLEGRADSNVELLLDTSFIVGLLDLSSEAAHHTCTLTMNLAQKLGYKLTVLSITLDETRALLERHAEDLGYSPTYSILVPHSVEAACSRRQLTRTDLQRIGGSLQTRLQRDHGCHIQSVSSRFIKKAEKSEIYQRIEGRRNNPDGARHDALAVFYVKSKRGKPCKFFPETNCWFVTSHNPQSAFGVKRHDDGTFFETIRAEYLLNILWLANPASRLPDVSEAGLTKLVASTLAKALPSHTIIREFDANLQKFKPDVITVNDVALVASSTATRSADRLEQLNSLAQSKPDEFCDEVIRIAQVEREKRQREYDERLAREKTLFERMESQRRESGDRLDEATMRLRESKENELSALETSLDIAVHLRSKAHRSARIIRWMHRLDLLIGWSNLTLSLILAVQIFGWKKLEPIAWIVSLSVSAFFWALTIAVLGRRVDIYDTWRRFERSVLSKQMGLYKVSDEKIKRIEDRRAEVRSELNELLQEATSASTATNEPASGGST